MVGTIDGGPLHFGGSAPISGGMTKSHSEANLSSAAWWYTAAGQAPGDVQASHGAMGVLSTPCRFEDTGVRSIHADFSAGPTHSQGPPKRRSRPVSGLSISCFSTDERSSSRTRSQGTLPPLSTRSSRTSSTADFIPLSFEDVYSMARKRVALKSAQRRKGGSGRLSHSGGLASLPEIWNVSFGNRARARGQLPGMGDFHANKGTTETRHCNKHCQDDVGRDNISNAWTAKALAAKDIDMAQPIPLVARSDENSTKAACPGRGGNESNLLMPHPGRASTSARRASVVSTNTNMSNTEAIRSSVRGDLKKMDPELRDVVEGKNISAILARFSEGEFKAKEVERMREEFRKLCPVGSQDVGREVLPDILSSLGYFNINSERIVALATEVTQYQNLDLEEFLSFMNRYIIFEREQVKKVFQDFDEDNSGSLTIDEIRKVFVELGVVPLYSTIKDAMQFVDNDFDGTLDLHEYIHLLAAYRETEGFSRNEVFDLYRVYERFAEPSPSSEYGRELPARYMFDALLHMFGPQAMSIAKEIAAKLLNEDVANIKTRLNERAEEKERLEKGAAEEVKKEKKGKEMSDLTSRAGFRVGSKSTVKRVQKKERIGLSFREFLNWARRLRQAEVALYQRQFLEFDTSGDGKIEYDELWDCMSILGFTPLRGPLVDAVAKVTDTPLEKVMLDFEQFYNVMIVFRSADGFTDAETEELYELFGLFDENRKGVVTFFQFIDLVRHSGRRHSPRTCRRMVKETDLDGTMTLNPREFLHVMRLLREEELRSLKSRFEESVGPVGDYMSPEALKVALELVGYKITDEELVELKKRVENPQGISFDVFVQLVDSTRRNQLDMWRVNAAFTREELDEFRSMFDKYDWDGSGTIEQEELVSLIADLQLPMSTVDDQKSFLATLDKSRRRAFRAGMTEADVFPFGCAEVNFKLFPHLFRSLERQELEAQEARFEEVMRATKFTSAEVQGFHEVFDHWVGSLEALEKAHLEKCGISPMVRSRPQTPKETLMDVVGGGRHGTEPLLNFDGIKRLLKSLGIFIREQMLNDLQAVVEKMSPQGTRDVDFMGFLRLMRWMLDTDFGGVVKYGAFLDDEEKMKEARLKDDEKRRQTRLGTMDWEQ